MGYKDVENRPWRIGRGSQHGPYRSYHQANFTVELPSRVYVHSGLSQSDMTKDITLLIRDKLNDTQRQIMAAILIEPGLFHGGIIGEVDIVDCVTESQSIWFEGRYGFILSNPVLYKQPIPCRGQLGFFEPNIDSPIQAF